MPDMIKYGMRRASIEVGAGNKILLTPLDHTDEVPSGYIQVAITT